MCDKAKFEVCRLCLNTRGLLINVFGEKNNLQFMLEKTIEDLIDVKVVEDANYPWLVCSTCMDMLTEFRLFKRRCAECLFVFYNRIQKGCNPTTKDWIPNREEFPVEMKEDIDEDGITSDTVQSSAVDVQDDMIIIKEEIDAASGCSVAPEKDVELPIIASMQENDSHWSGNDEAGNMFLQETKKEIDEDPVTSDSVYSSAVDVQDDMIVHKEEIGDSSGWSTTKEIDVYLPMVPSIQEGDSHCSGNDEAGNLDHLGNREFHLSSGEEIYDKEEYDVDIPQKEEDLRGELLQVQDDGQGQEGTGKESGLGEDGAGDLLNKCHVCKKLFNKRELLKAHIMHMHLKQFMCGICSDTFECKIDLHEHVKLVHAVGRDYGCQQCSRRFRNTNELRMHLSTHSSERPYVCEICWEAFTEKALLSRHMSAHPREKQHRCGICSRAFTQTGDLKRHILTHTGEKPYKCTICSKAFNRNEVLKSHMFTHTGERPHKCAICSRAFSQRGDLRKHMLTHTGERAHQCGVCFKAFSRKQHLDRHSLTHSGKRDHSCAICSREFTDKSNLNRHKKQHINMQ